MQKALTFVPFLRIFGKRPAKTMSIQDNIQAAAAGDHRAFAAIVEQYRQMVWRVALRMLGNPDEAEDAVQETFIRAWKTLPGFDRRYSPATWLGTIAARLCCDILRKRSAHRKFEADAAWSNAQERAADPESGSIARELEDRLLRVTRTLSPMQRTVFVLHEIEQLPFEEIRRATGWSPVQLKSNLYLARQKVRRTLEKEL